MSHRGIKFSFSPGEFVLCFEPDPTKARVIYEAKILDTTVYRDGDGKRQPGYHIHFLRWNHSWDRIVNESFVLKNTDENRHLMKQLADVARKVRKNKSRRKKIGEILAEAFNGKPPPFESEEEESDEENTTDTNDTGDESNTESDSVNSDNKTEDQKKKTNTNVNLEIPEGLRVILDRDYFAINQDKKRVKLPADINVVEVLESFVKTFMLDFWSPSFDRSFFCHTPPKIAIERILPMCKEFVDGMRICFDFLLPLLLLYDVEKDQYQRITNAYRLKSPARHKQLAEDSPLLQSPRSRMSSRRSATTDEPSPKLPKLSPNILCDEEEDEEVTFNHQGSSRRRLTRSATQDTPGSKKGSGDVPSPEKSERPHRHSGSSQEKKSVDKKSEKNESPTKNVRTRRSSDRGENMLRRRALRNHRKSSDASSESDQSKPDTVLSEPLRTEIKTEKTDRPPPLLIPCNINASRQNGSDKGVDKGATGSTDSMGDSGREEILDNVLSWQMLPPDIQAELPTPPSLLYGAHHLLRLFVKLPGLLTQMEMEENKLGVLVKLLHQFLIYLSEHVVELFPETSYES